MDPTKEQTNVWIGISLAQRELHRAIDGALREANLPSLKWYDVLWELDRATDGLRPFELKSLVLFEQSNLSRVVQRMVKERLIGEHPSRKDGRGKVLMITDSGRELRRRMWKVYGPLIRQNIERIEDSFDLRVVAGALSVLADRKSRKP
jgi:DNA-binding MarR family transcriptional regulator